MNEDQALNIIMKLVDGIDPRSGKVLPAQSPYQDAEVLRALFTAVLALKYQRKHKGGRKTSQENSGSEGWKEQK